MAEAQSSILIVDDDAEDLASVERALRGLGCALLSIRDPHEVMPGVQRHRPDVVILDALLPGLSGFDLCKQIKSEPQLKGTPVLIVTGVYLRQQYRHEALQQFKADAFLIKPFRPPELQRLVVQLLARKTRLPQSSFLKRLGLPSGPESRKRGLFGRLFGRSEEEEPTSLRIAPAPRDAAPAPEPPPAPPIEAAPAAEIEPPKAAPAAKPKKSRKAKKAERAVASPDPVVESAAEPAKPEAAPAPVAVAVEEPQKSAMPEPPSEERVAAADTVASPVDEVKPDPEPIAADALPPEGSPEPPSAPEPALATETATTPAPESPPTPASAAEPENVESLVTVREAPSREATEGEPSPATLLDAPPPAEGDDVTWIVAESRTQDMTLQEAAARAASSGEPEPPPAAFEDLAAARAEIEEEKKEEAPPPLRRPLFRVGEVPIYDEPDFLTEFKRELSKCRRVDRPLTLILIRVGDLGQIIELFGKDFRERVLWHIADQAMQSLREVDLVGMMSSKNLIALTAFASDRYGGGRIVARLRQAMHRKPFRVGEELPPIIPALDFGMASFPADGNDVSSLLARAEEDLPRVEEKPAALD